MRVSCLMVTLPVPARLPLLRRAVDAYLRQSHGDRELVVVMDQGTAADRAAAAALLAGHDRADIRVHAVAVPLTLGALRNLSVAQATGDILCQWDDDDLHHPDRIALQLAALDASGRDAAILRDVLLYREADRTLHWTNWAATPVGGHPATLICRRNADLRYPEAGPEARRGEDLAAVARLAATGALHRQPDAPHLYVYVTHAANTCDADHHALLARTLAISPGLLRRREAALRAGLAPFDFGDGPIGVDGPGGRGFTV